MMRQFLPLIKQTQYECDISINRYFITIFFMKHASVREEEQNQALLLSERRKYPEVFKWKVGAIIIAILMVIFLAIDIFMMVYLSQHELRKANYSFAADLLTQLSKSNLSASQFANMMKGLANSNDELWFQKADLITSWSQNDPGELGLARVVDFFQQKVVDRFTVVRFRDNIGNEWVTGAYTHVSFQIPESWQQFLIGQNKEYYTFEIGDDRQSSLVGGANPIYMKMDASDLNLTNCKILSLSQSDIKFLQGVQVILFSDQIANSPYVQLLELNSDISSCFSSNDLTGTFFDWLKSAVGSNIQSTVQYTIQDITTFELDT